MTGIGRLAFEFESLWLLQGMTKLESCREMVSSANLKVLLVRIERHCELGLVKPLSASIETRFPDDE